MVPAVAGFSSPEAVLRSAEHVKSECWVSFMRAEATQVTPLSVFSFSASSLATGSCFLRLARHGA